MTLLHALDKAYTTQNGSKAYEKPNRTSDTIFGSRADVISARTRDRLLINETL
jgi:hypothetical protein